MEKNKTTSVSKKVLKVITVVTLSMYAFMLVVIGTVAKNSIYSLEEDYMSEVSRNVSTNIERTMNEYLSIVKILSESSTIKQVLASADGGLNTMQGHYRAEEIVHDFTAIKKDYPDSILTVAILDVEQDGYFLDNGAYSDSSFSFKERPYYSVVTTGQMLVTDPYLDTLTGDMVISIVAPVFSDNGTVLGAVLVDVVIDFVQQLVSASDFDSTGTSVILDINKNIIASTTGTLGNNYSSISMTGDLLSSQLSNPTGVLFEMSMQGLDRVGIVNKIGDLGWVTVTSLGDQQYKEHANEVLRVLLAQLIIAYVLTMVIISKTINKRLKPLEVCLKRWNILQKVIYTINLTLNLMMKLVNLPKISVKQV
ncbi:MAG: cache domain-containing protein [Clostridia bacterium]